MFACLRTGHGTIGLLRTFLPAAAEPWVEFYQNRPVQLILLGSLILGLLWVSTQLQRSINDRMRALDANTAKPGSVVTPSSPPCGLGYPRLRSHRRYRWRFLI